MASGSTAGAVAAFAAHRARISSRSTRDGGATARRLILGMSTLGAATSEPPFVSRRRSQNTSPPRGQRINASFFRAAYRSRSARAMPPEVPAQIKIAMQGGLALPRRATRPQTQRARQADYSAQSGLQNTADPRFQTASLPHLRAARRPRGDRSSRPEPFYAAECINMRVLGSFSRDRGLERFCTMHDHAARSFRAQVTETGE